MKYKILVGTASYHFIPLHPTAPAHTTHIYTLTFDPSSRGNKPVLCVCGVFNTAGINPSWLALSPTNKSVLLACNEDPIHPGKLSAFQVNLGSGEVLEVLSQTASGATGPCYATVTRDGRFALVANYDPAVLCSFSVTSTGTLSNEPKSRLTFHDPSSIDKVRQSTPHGHCILQHPTQHNLVYVADLGADCVRLLYLNQEGMLEATKNFFGEPGCGPRQIAFHPSGKYLYCLYELSHSVACWSISLPSGELFHIQTIDIAAVDTVGDSVIPFQKLSGAAIRLSADGRFLYTSMRGDSAHPDGDCLTVVEFHPIAEPNLEIIQYARAPYGGWHIRDLSLSPDENYVVAGSMANGGEVIMFKRNQENGKLDYVNRLKLTDAEGRHISAACFLWLDR